MTGTTAKEKKKSEFEFNNLLSRLQFQDKSLRELKLCDTIVLTRDINSFNELFRSIYLNKYLINVEFLNIYLKDAHCLILMEALVTCPFLESLNLERNYLSNIGIEMVTDMVENHSSIRELKLANQKNSRSNNEQSDRAFINCFSKNTNITKFSHNFSNENNRLVANQLIHRNLIFQRQIRASIRLGKSFVIPEFIESYPYQKVYISDELKLQARSILLSDSKDTMAFKLVDSVVSAVVLDVNSSNKDTVVDVTSVVENVPEICEDRYDYCDDDIDDYAVIPRRTAFSKFLSFICLSSSDVYYNHHSITRDSLATASHITNMKNSSAKTAYSLLIDQLSKNDPSFTDIVIQDVCESSPSSHAAVIAEAKDKPTYYQLCSVSLMNNVNIMSIELVNVGMRDADCVVLVKALATCSSLEKINFQSNHLTSVGIIVTANMVERHLCMRELRLANQQTALHDEKLLSHHHHQPYTMISAFGIDSSNVMCDQKLAKLRVSTEEALVSCLKNNPNVTKLVYRFREKHLDALADKYIQRNFKLECQIHSFVKAGTSFRVVTAVAPAAAATVTTTTTKSSSTRTSTLSSNSSSVSTAAKQSSSHIKKLPRRQSSGSISISSSSRRVSFQDFIDIVPLDRSRDECDCSCLDTAATVELSAGIGGDDIKNKPATASSASFKDYCHNEDSKSINNQGEVVDLCGGSDSTQEFFLDSSSSPVEMPCVVGRSDEMVSTIAVPTAASAATDLSPGYDDVYRDSTERFDMTRAQARGSVSSSARASVDELDDVEFEIAAVMTKDDDDVEIMDVFIQKMPLSPASIAVVTDTAFCSTETTSVRPSFASHINPLSPMSKSINATNAITAASIGNNSNRLLVVQRVNTATFQSYPYNLPQTNTSERCE